MSILFWILWVIDLLLVILIMGGSNFRSSFGAGTDFNSWLLIGLVIILIGSLLLKFCFKLKWISLVIVGLPLIGLMLMYLFEKKTKVG